MADVSVVWTGMDVKTWTVVNDPTVNPKAADSYLPYVSDSNQVIAMTCSTSYGGALAKWNTGDPGQVMAYLGLDWEGKLDALTIRNGQCYENDVKASVETPKMGQTLQNVIDGSAQLNLGAGGMWQIDDSATPIAHWIDTGFKPGLPPVDTWIPYSLRFFYNEAAKQFSVTSITQNGVFYSIPTNLQRLPLRTTNWARGIVLQRQLVIRDKPAHMAPMYRNTRLTMSSTPIAVPGVSAQDSSCDQQYDYDKSDLKENWDSDIRLPE